MNRTISEDIYHRRTALAIIIFFSIIRGVIAFSMELGTDEAYYWLYSQDIKWNYFDHPPMVAIWIRLFTANLALQDIEGFIRLGSIVGCAIASWAIYKTCHTLHSSKAGLYGVVLYNASFYASITAGIFIMPDTPQMVFYTISLWMIARLTKDEKDWLTWIAFGVAAGLCIISKVYGAALWTGLGLFAILKRRNWFLQPYMYVAFLATAVIISPILVWNLQNDFLTYKFHSDRVAVTEGGLDMITFCREVIHQVFYNNPFNVFVMIAALITFLRKRKVKGPSTDALSAFNFIALPLAVLLLVISLFRDTTLPHWSGPAYVALIPIAAIYLTGCSIRYTKRILLASLSSLVAFLVLWQYLIHYAPASIGSRDIDKNSF
ncbi:MAG TPA: glycosyltransferase family 39 protein, partial [Flavisolibacter sp.]